MRPYLLALVVFSYSMLCLDCGPGRPSSPDLTASKAAEIISSSPGFNRYRQLVSVEKTLREGDSLAECCYNAWFTLRLSPEGKHIPARAQFRYDEGAWHLYEYSYGEPPNMTIVSVCDGCPKPEALTTK